MFVDKAGTAADILDDNDMYPWGGIVPGVGKTTSNNTIKFTGQYRDADTAANLDYFGARYYSNTVGRFMSPDWASKPIGVPYAEFGDPQSLNLYSYAHNNPIVHMDANGHDILVIENGPTQGNPIGHTAVAITGQGVFSFGNDTKPGSSTSAYLSREAHRRDTRVFVLKTTPAQDKAAAEYLKAQPDKIGIVSDNCATRSIRALDAADIPQPAIVDEGAIPANNLPGWAGYRAANAGATQIDVPKGSTTIPGSLSQFEPGAQQHSSNTNIPEVGTASGTYYFRDGRVMTVTTADDARQQDHPMIDFNSGYSVGPR